MNISKLSLIDLKPLAESDLPLFLTTYTDTEMMINVGAPLTIKETVALFYRVLSEIGKKTPQYLFYVIKKGDIDLGIIGLLWNQKARDKVELGIMVSKTFHGKGYAYKAVKLLMESAFDELNIKSMIVLCNLNNTMANRISHALGFKNKGTIQSQLQHKIKWEITIEQFRQSQKR